jgi:hypothetical protein
MPSPNNPTRYPAGVVDATQDGAWGNFLQPRPQRYVDDFDDFMAYRTGEWILTETAAGSTEVLSTTGDGGWLLITNAAAGASDEASIQWGGGNAAVITPYTWVSTKDFHLSARFKVSDATNTALIIGMAIADTTPVASLPANGIFFTKAAASTSLLASVRKAGVSTSVTLGAMADDTFVEVAMVYTAADGYWRAYLNDVLIGSFNTASVSPTVGLTKTIGLLNATAIAHVLSVDNLNVAKQR